MKEEQSRAFFAGMKDTIPLLIGAAPFGLIFGALAVTSGLTPISSAGMSLMVFAGSSQFIAANLLAEGTPFFVIILTTFIVNLRHGLYGASLAPYFNHLPQKWLAPLSFGLTDESYAVTIRFLNKEHDIGIRQYYLLGSVVFMYANWLLWTILGIFAGKSIAGIENWGLDFAMVATFIGIVVPLIETMPMLASALAAGLTAVLANNFPYKLGIFLAALVGITVGLLLEKRKKTIRMVQVVTHE